MDNAQARQKQLHRIMTEQPMTKETHDAIQRRRVEQRRHLEDLRLEKDLASD